MERFVQFVLSHRGPWGVLLVLLALGAGWSMSRVRVDFTTQELFAANDPQAQTLARFRAQFGYDDNTAVLMIESDDAFAPDALRALWRLTRGAEKLADVRRVDSLATVGDLGETDAGAVDTRPLLHEDPAGLDAGQRATLRRRAIGNPLLAGKLVSRDGTVAVLAVYLQNRRLSAAEVGAAVDALEALVRREALPDRIKVRLAGVPLVRRDAVRQILDDQARFMPLGGLFTAFFLFLVYRRLQGVLVPLLAVGLAVAFTVAVMPLLDLSLDILNNVLPLLIMVYGVADAVHMLSRIHEEGAGRKNSPSSIRRAMGRLGTACLITSLTTAIGFASLTAAGMNILKRFGMLAAIGVVMAYLVTMVVVPIGASVGGGIHRKQGPTWLSRAMDRVLARIAVLVQRAPVPLLLLGLLLAGTGLWLARDVPVDNFLLGVYRDDHPVTRATRLVETKLEGVVRMQVSVRGDKGAFKEPKVLAAVARLQRWMEAQPGITATISPADFVAEMHRAVVGTRKLPDTRQAVAQLLLMTEGETGMERLVDFDYSWGRVRASLRDIGAQKYLALTARAREKVAEVFAGLPLKVEVTGTSLVAYRGINRLVEDLLTSLGLALAVIALVLMLVFRSPTVGLLSLVPNTIPLAAGLAFMWLTEMNLEPATMMVYSIALGIAVDDTIHFIVRYREEARAGATAAEAVKTTLATAGRAMVITSCLLIAGFAVTQTSGFPTTTNFGTLSVVVLTAALATDLLVTPATLLIVKPWTKRNGKRGRSLEV